jgi:hypothetical protein
MMVHHATTIFLLGFATYYGFCRAGAVIMLIHDCSDPALEFAKTCFYAGKETVRYLIW